MKRKSIEIGALAIIALCLILGVAILAQSQQLPAPHQAKLQDVKDLAFDCSIRERMLQLDQADLVAKIAALEKELAALKKEKP